MQSGERDPYLDRIIHSLREKQGSGDGSAGSSNRAPERREPQVQEAGEEEAPPASSTEETTEEAEGFSPIDLRDRVVVMLLFNQVVRVEQVEVAWYNWNAADSAERPASFWRMLLRHPEVDRKAVFEEAARVYAFEEAELSRYGVLAFLRDHRNAFTNGQWQRLCTLNVIPLEVDRTGSKPQWVFATHDPTLSETGRFLGTLVDHHALRYAPEVTVAGLLREAFPQWVQPTKPAPTSGASPSAARRTRRKGEPAYAPDLDDEPDTQPEPAGPPSTETLMDFLDRLLVEAVQTGVTKIYLFPNAQRRTEVHFAVQGRLMPWHEEGRLPAEAVMSFFKTDIIRRGQLGKQEQSKTVIQRWIDGERMHFQVARTTVQDGSKSIRTEMIVIKVLDRG